MYFLVLCTLFLPSWHITAFVFLLQSLRARTEQTLVRTQQDESDSSRFAVKQVLSFTLTEQVKLRYIGSYLIVLNLSDN